MNQGNSKGYGYVSSSHGVRIDGFLLERENAPDKLHQAIVEERTPFSQAKYLEGHAPYPLPDIDTSALNQEYARCLMMPIRLAGGQVYSIPNEWIGLIDIIREIIIIEESVNPSWQDYNTYLTVDYSPVKAEEQQRRGGLHADGYQGANIVPKLKSSRAYVMTSNGGTRFYPHPFVTVDDTRLNVFEGFDLQAEDDKVMIAKEHCVYFIDAYCVHESGFASRDGFRTFARLTFDLEICDRKGDTKNSLIDYDWEMVDRGLHARLSSPSLSDVEEAKVRFASQVNV